MGQNKTFMKSNANKSRISQMFTKPLINFLFFIFKSYPWKDKEGSHPLLKIKFIFK